MATRKKLGGSQIEASDAIYDFSCSPCSEDGKNSEALYHCSICQAFYCQRCVDIHSKFTKNHKVTDKTSDTFGQGLGKSATSSNNLPTDLCEEHHGEVVKMFCPQHDVVCCTVCIAVKHRSCEGVEYIPNIARGLLKNQGKEKTKHSLEKVRADLKNLKSKMEDDLRNLDKQRDGIIDDIQEFKKRIISRVEEFERKSLKEVKAKHKELANESNAYSKKIDDLLKVIDTRLNKITHSPDNNEAQQFVNVKNGEKELLNVNDLVKQAMVRQAKNMDFEINKDIERYLCKEQSLGSLIEWSSQTNVNSVCPFDTQIACAFLYELRTQLKSYNIKLERIEPTEVTADRFTIVLFENDIGSEDKAVKDINRVHDNKIILIHLKPSTHGSFLPHHLRSFKGSFAIEYDTEYDILGNLISFQNENNRSTYESVSKIVKDLSSIN